MTIAETAMPAIDSGPVVSKKLERKGRLWLIAAFVFCPCHLPVSMAVLAAIFGGSATGALIANNTWTVGIVLGAIYLAGCAVGFYYLKKAGVGKNCKIDFSES